MSRHPKYVGAPQVSLMSWSMEEDEDSDGADFVPPSISATVQRKAATRMKSAKSRWTVGASTARGGKSAESLECMKSSELSDEEIDDEESFAQSDHVDGHKRSGNPVSASITDCEDDNLTTLSSPDHDPLLNGIRISMSELQDAFLQSKIDNSQLADKKRLCSQLFEAGDPSLAKKLEEYWATTVSWDVLIAISNGDIFGERNPSSAPKASVTRMSSQRAVSNHRISAMTLLMSDQSSDSESTYSENDRESRGDSHGNTFKTSQIVSHQGSANAPISESDLSEVKVACSEVELRKEKAYSNPNQIDLVYIPPPTQIAFATSAIMEGWLEKRSSWSGLWTKRYFVLCESSQEFCVLKCFSKAVESAWGMIPLQLRTVIPASSIASVKTSTKKSSKGRQFSILTTLDSSGAYSHFESQIDSAVTKTIRFRANDPQTMLSNAYSPDMYFVDPATTLAIIYPRTYRLRQLQEKEGKDITALKLEQRGLAPITYLHHVSKIIEGKTESYRVRICRTCSGLPILLELGSYADVESALLVNDIHEILQNRTKQLHLLVPEDIEYVKYLTVRRRGGLHDLVLITVLQERLLKTLTKKKPAKTSDFDPPEISSEASLPDSSVATCSNTSSDTATPLSSPLPKDQDVIDAGYSIDAGDKSGTLMSLVEIDASSNAPGDLNDLNKRGGSFTGHYPQEKKPKGSQDPSNRSEFASNTSSGRSGGSIEQLSAVRPLGMPSASNAMSPKLRWYHLIEQLKSNLMDCVPNLVTWKYFDSVELARVMLSALGEYLASEVAGSKSGLTLDVGVPWPVLQARAARFLRSISTAWVFPRCTVYLMISTFCPGDSGDVECVLRYITAVLPSDSSTVQRYSEYTRVVLTAAQKQSSFFSIISPQESVDRMAQSQVQYQLVGLKTCFDCLNDFEVFCRQLYLAGAYYDYALRLSVWDGEIAELIDAETKVQGLFGQIVVRIQLSLEVLIAVVALVPCVKRWIQVNSARNSSEDIASLCVQYFQRLSTICQRIFLGSAMLVSAACGAAVAACKLCHDTVAAQVCVENCLPYFPILFEHLTDPVVLQFVSQRVVDVMAVLLRNFRPQFQSSSLGNELSLKLKAFSMGAEMITQTRKFFLALPRDLVGASALSVYESAFRAYVSIYLLSESLGDSDFLAKFGYSVPELFVAINESLTLVNEFVQKLGCKAISTFTMLSMHCLVDSCIDHNERFRLCGDTVYKCVRICRVLLWNYSSRFVLAKMLLENVVASEEKQLAAKEIQRISRETRHQDEEEALQLLHLKHGSFQSQDDGVGEVGKQQISAKIVRDIGEDKTSLLAGLGQPSDARIAGDPVCGQMSILAMAAASASEFL